MTAGGTLSAASARPGNGVVPAVVPGDVVTSPSPAASAIGALIEWVGAIVLASDDDTGLITVQLSTAAPGRDGAFSVRRAGAGALLVEPLGAEPPARWTRPGLWDVPADALPWVPGGATAVSAALDTPTARLGVTLVRPPSAGRCGLDDLVTVEDGLALRASHLSALPTFDMTPPLLTQTERMLVEMLGGESTHDISRQLVRFIQAGLLADGCVIYLPDAGRDDAPGRGLALAATAGSGLGLTSPWLSPSDQPPSGPFAAAPRGPALTFAPDHWQEWLLPDGVHLGAVPLHWEGELVAVVGIRHRGMIAALPEPGMRRGTSAALALRIGQQRQAARTAQLGLRADLARATLAHEATLALLDGADLRAALEAQARKLVPAIADGYTVYLADRYLDDDVPDLASASNRSPTGFRKVACHWSTFRPPAETARYERWFGSVGSCLLATRAGDPPAVVGGTTRDEWTAIAAALPHEGETVGWLVLIVGEQRRRMSRHDQSLAGDLAAPLARTLVARGMLTDRRGQSAHDSLPTPGDGTAAHLEAVSTAVGLSLDADTVDEVAERLVAGLAGVVRGWAVVELLPDDASGRRAVIAGQEPGRAPVTAGWREVIRDGDGSRGPARVMTTGQPELAPDLGWEDGESRWVRSAGSPYADIGPTTSLSLPLAVDGVTYGALTCMRSQAFVPFGLADLESLEHAAHLISLRIRNIRRRQADATRIRQLEWGVDYHTRVLANLAVGVIVTDPEGRITHANRVARQLHGDTALPPTVGEYIRLMVLGGIDGQPFDPHEFPLVRALATGLERRGAWQVIRPDGSTTAVRGTAVPIVLEGGSPGGMVITLRDITAEHELDLRRQQFMISLSHDLRSPLTSIKGWAQFLGQRTDGDIEIDRAAELRAFDAIVKQTRSLQRLIDRFISAARREMEEAAALHLQPVELVDFTRRIVRVHQGLTQRHRITFAADGIDRLDGRWDPDALERIIGNLLSNAIKYSPGGGDIDVTMRREDAIVAIAVRDHGIGIPAATLPAIFDQYFRGHEDPESAETPSQGLGLYNARQQAHRMQAELDVESAVGVGSTFTLRLPITEFVT